MMNLGQFTRFPAAFKDREKLVDKVYFISINNTKTDYGFEIISKTNKYNQTIEIHDEKINLRSPIKIMCDCQSFKFEFSHAVFKNGSLINPMQFIRSIVQHPKEKNQHDLASGCKHIIKLAREILKIKIK